MNLKDLEKLAEEYSTDLGDQHVYMAGFIEACDIIRKKLNSCYMEEFIGEMEEMAKLSY